MHKSYFKILMVLLGLVVAVQQSNAQHYPDTVSGVKPPIEEISDTVETVEAIEDSAAYDADADTTTYTLYFSDKEDPRNMFDSTLIDLRVVPDSVVHKMKADPDFWYVDKTRYQQEKKKEAPSIREQDEPFWVRFFRFLYNNRRVIWIIMGLTVVTALVWFLVKNKMNIFGRSRRRIIATPDALAEETAMQPDELQAAINDAVAKGDYRLAIRYHYLLLLRKMDEAGIITYKEDTTNMQYLMQVYNKSYYKDFFTVTRHYEYAWYGDMPVNTAVYEVVQSGFTSLMNLLPVKS